MRIHTWLLSPSAPAGPPVCWPVGSLRVSVECLSPAPRIGMGFSITPSTRHARLKKRKKVPSGDMFAWINFRALWASTTIIHPSTIHHQPAAIYRTSSHPWRLRDERFVRLDQARSTHLGTVHTHTQLTYAQLIRTLAYFSTRPWPKSVPQPESQRTDVGRLQLGGTERVSGSKETQFC